MRKLLIAASMLLALTVVPSTAAQAGGFSHARPFIGAGRATLVVDPETGSFVIDGRVIATEIGVARLHSEGFFTGEDTFQLASTFTGSHGNTITTVTTGQTFALDNGDVKFKDQDQVTGGTCRFDGATGKTTTVGISHPHADDPTVSDLTFVFAGFIRT
jgi:hypothetical protein